VAERFPAYLAPEPDTPRSQRSRAILAGDHRFTFAEWTQLGLDTKIGIAAARVPELLTEFAKLTQADAAKVADLVNEIRTWNQVGRNDSVATTLFVRMETLARANGQGQIRALEQVKAALEASFGTWKVAWGEVNRLQRVHTSGTEEQFSDARPSVPVPGAPSFTGTILTFGTREAPGQKRMYGTVGDTYVSVVEFGKRPEAHSLLVLGESADAQSKHYFDQAELYSTQRFKPAWFDLGEIKKHVERKYQVTTPGTR
jgi:acyl-homoserine lactone acylase PvdQ